MRGKQQTDLVNNSIRIKRWQQNQAYISSLAMWHQARAHNRRTAEYMRNIGKSKVYVVSELSANNEQWINRTSAVPNCRRTMRTSNGWSRKRLVVPCRKRSVSAKGRTARLSKWQDVHPYVRVYYSSDRTPHWQMCINLARVPKTLGHHTTPNLPAQRRRALAERTACPGGQGEFQGWRKVVQTELPCAYRIRLDEPRYRQEPQTQ